MPRSASSKMPRFWARASSECALLVAEQLAFQQCGGNGRAVHGDERLGLPQALGVKCFGDQVLAGPALAIEQDRAWPRSRLCAVRS